MRTDLFSSIRRKWSRIGSFSASQWRVVFAAVALLPAVQMSLRFRGFKRTAAQLATCSQRSALPAGPDTARPIADAVTLVAGRRLVGAPCLARSLVVWFLLRRRGIDAVLVIGAGATNDGVLPAHAWVEVDDVPVNDLSDVRDRYGSFALLLPRLQSRATAR